MAGPALSFDPPPGDGTEGDGSLGALTDGDAATAWRSEGYRNRDLGGLKDGVGIVLTLAEPVELGDLEVDAATVDWSASVYVADEIPEDLGGWGDPVANEDGIDGAATFDLDGAEGRHVLLWFTDLGDGSVGEGFRLEVAEVRLTGG